MIRRTGLHAAQVETLEMLLAYQLLMAAHAGSRYAPAAGAWVGSLRAAKIGAAALGAGAVFAVTGATAMHAA